MQCSTAQTLEPLNQASMPIIAGPIDEQIKSLTSLNKSNVIVKCHTKVASCSQLVLVLGYTLRCTINQHGTLLTRPGASSMWLCASVRACEPPPTSNPHQPHEHTLPTNQPHPPPGRQPPLGQDRRRGRRQHAPAPAATPPPDYRTGVWRVWRQLLLRCCWRWRWRWRRRVGLVGEYDALHLARAVTTRRYHEASALPQRSCARRKQRVQRDRPRPRARGRGRGRGHLAGIECRRPPQRPRARGASLLGVGVLNVLRGR